MRILYLNHNLRGRGTWFRCWHFARQLAGRGHEVTLWTASPGVRWTAARERVEGVEVVETPRWRAGGRHDGGWGPSDIAWRVLESARGGYDIVHAFDHRPSVSVPWLTLTGRPGVAALTDWADWWGRGGILAGRRPLAWLEEAEAWWEEETKRRAEMVTCISRVLWERARGLGIPEDRLAWIPSGAETEVFRPLDRVECRRAFGLPEDAPVVGFAGFQLWDLALLFDAFRMVAAQVPAARLLVMGPAAGVQVPDTIRQAVHFAGTVPYDGMPRALNCADVLALPLEDNPANRGRFPQKLAEYMATGRPVVTQDVGDTGGVIRESGGGTITEGTAESFAEGLARLLTDHEAARHCGAKARQHAVEHLEWRDLAARMEAVYARLTPARRSAGPRS